MIVAINARMLKIETGSTENRKTPDRYMKGDGHFN